MIPKGYCQCGCGRKTKPAPRTVTRNGWVKGEPLRFVRGHNTPESELPPLFDEDAETHCWVWGRSKTAAGYGMHLGGMAHRIFYEDFIGPIPEGLCLDHLCRNRACCNPGHLEPVTMKENLARGEGAGAKNARKTHCPKGHPLEGDNLDRAGLARGQRRCLICKREGNRASYRRMGGWAAARAKKSQVTADTTGENANG